MAELHDGIVPATVTPFGEDGRVDLGLLGEHVSWLAEQGVTAVSPMGTTGEGQSLSLAERRQVIEALAGHPSGIRFVPGTGCTALPETVELSRFAVEQGALAILLAPPSYYPPDGLRGLVGFYGAVLEALPAEGRVLLYHIERHTRAPISDEAIRELVARYGPAIAGMKDSSGDLQHVLGWLRDFPGLQLFCGADVLATEFAAAGGRAMITAGGNVHPRALERILRGEDDGSAQAYVDGVRDLVSGPFPRQSAIKLLVSEVSGIPWSRVRPPLRDLEPDERDALTAAFREVRPDA